MDNEDFDDYSSLSGTEGKHYTALTLYQDSNHVSKSKPSLSSIGLTKSVSTLKEKLSCQEVPPCHQPPARPTLTDNFPIEETCTADSK